jgi:MFS family permease
MFVPSPLTGRLAVRAGPALVATSGLVILICTGLAGGLAGGDDAAIATAILAALGVGWNCGIVGASTLLADSVPVRLRAHVEGIGEAAMGLAAGVGAPVAGLVLALSSLPGVWLLTAALAAGILALTRPRR